MHRRFVHKVGFWLLTALMVGMTSSAGAQSPTDEELFLPLIGQSGTEPVQWVEDASETITVEGTVEQVVSEHPEGEPIISRATLRVEKVLEGVVDAERVIIRYLGGTVGDLTLYVSHQPVLAEGMVIRATLVAIEDGEFAIDNVDTDLVILEVGAGGEFAFLSWRWQEASLPVLLEINPNTADVAGTAERDAVLRGMATWNAVACSSFVFGGGDASSCTVNLANPDGVNCVEWRAGPGPTNWSGINLSRHTATTFSWHGTEVDIIFWEQHARDGPTTNINWSTNPNNTQLDVESVALHELGHALGLDHENDVTAVMNSTLNRGQELRSLFQDDINGVCARYPAGSRALSTSYVNRTAAAGGNCTQSKPCRTVTHGMKRVVDNGEVIIQAGTYRELLTLDRPMTLKSTGGTVTIDPNIR